MIWPHVSNRILRWSASAIVVSAAAGIASSIALADLGPVTLSATVIAILVVVVLARSTHNETMVTRQLLDRLAEEQTTRPGISAAAASGDIAYRPGSSLDSLRRDLQRDSSALLLLHKTVEARGFIPAPGGWAATPETLLALVNHIIVAPHIHQVVECGSGTSTVWMGLALRQRGSGKLISLEHDPVYAERTRNAVATAGVSAFVEIRHAPLETVTIGITTSRWYSSDATRDLSDVSLLFVDGPPAHTGPLARYPALPMLRDVLAPDAVVVLDDIDREEERDILNRWLAGEREAETPSWTVRSETDRAAIIERRVPAP